jgi:hypothetical protein
MVRELESEITRLQHEVLMVRASSADPCSLEVAEIETLLAKAARLLNA